MFVVGVASEKKKKAGLPTLLEQIPLNRCQQRHRTNTLLTDLATCTDVRPNAATPVTLTVESLRTSKGEKMRWRWLPKIEVGGPRPSLLRTSDWTRGPLEVFVRQVKSSSLSYSNIPTERQGRALYVPQILLFCTVHSRFLVVC